MDRSEYDNFLTCVIFTKQYRIAKRNHVRKWADFCGFQKLVKASAGAVSAQCGLLFLGDAVELGAGGLGRRTFQLTARGHDVAPARGTHRRRNARLENQAAERAHPFGRRTFIGGAGPGVEGDRSEEHTSELQSLMRTSDAVLCLEKKKSNNT